MRKQNSLKLLLCILLTCMGVSVWGETPAKTVDFKSWTKNQSSYSSTEWADLGCTFAWGANNNKGWSYVRFGTKGGSSASSTTTIDGYVMYNTAITDKITKVIVRHNGVSNASCTVNSVKLTVYSDASFSTQIDEVTLASPTATKTTDATFEFTPTSGTTWAANSYYKFTCNLTIKGKSNYGLSVYGLDFYGEAPVGPVINASDVKIAADATSGEIAYTIDNPASGVSFTAEKTTGDWISNVAVDAANNKVTFSATENTTDADRTGTITLKYTGATDKVVTVTQKKPVVYTNYDKVSASTMVIGGTYIWYAEKSDGSSKAVATAMGSNTYLGAATLSEDSKVTDTQLQLTTETPQQFIFSKKSATDWTIADAGTPTNYLYVSGDKKIAWGTTANVWTLSGDDAPAFACSTYSSTAYTMFGNLGSTRFDAYKAIGSMQNAILYHLNGEATSTLTLNVDGATTSYVIKQGFAWVPFAPTKDNTTFMGWATTQGGSIVCRAGAAYTMPTSDATLYAVWGEPAAAPTLTEAASFATSFDVTITNNESGATVYYTTDGNDPTTSSESFTGDSKTITITATTNVKAMAVISDKDNSQIANVTYTMLTPYTTFTDALAAATSTATEAAFTFNNQIVTAVSTKNAYLQDANGNVAVIYNATAHGFTQSQTLSGTVMCKIQKYNGILEFTNLTSSAAGITTGEGTPVATEKALADITTDDYGKLLKIADLKYDGTTAVLKNGDNEITPYTTFMETLPTFENGATYSVTGIFLTFNSKFEISPRSADDVVKTSAAEKTNPTLELGTYKTSLKVNETDEYTVSYDGDGTLKAESSDKNVAEVELSNGSVNVYAYKVGSVKITISAPETDAYYDASKEYTLYVTDVATLPFSFDGGKADIASTAGMSQTGLGTDYSSSPKLKFGSTGAELVINYGANANTLSYKIQGNSFSGGTFDVMESADGSDYTSVKSYTSFGSSATEESCTLNTASRYVKFVYTTKSAGNVALGAISISYEKADPQFAFENETYSFTTTEDKTVKATSAAGSTGKVTYSTTEDASVFLIDENSGDIVCETVGTYSVSATIEATDDYAAKTVSATVKVVVPKTYSNVALVAKYGDKYYAMDTTFQAVEVFVNEDGKVYAPATIADVITWKKGEDGSTTSFQNAYGKYLTAGSKTTLSLAADEFGWTKDTETDTWYNSTRSFFYGASADAFKNYALTNAGASGFSELAHAYEIAVLEVGAQSAEAGAQAWTATTYSTSVATGKYATLCLPYNADVEGAQLYTMAGKTLSDDGSVASVSFDEVADNKVVGGVPYLFQATADAQTFTKTGTDAAAIAPVANNEGYTGTYTSVDLPANDGYYFLSNKNNAQTFALAGNNIHVGAFKCYISNFAYAETLDPAAQNAPGRITLGELVMPGIQTGLDAVSAQGENQKFLLNGKLFIRHNGQLFNAAGQLVK